VALRESCQYQAGSEHIKGCGTWCAINNDTLDPCVRILGGMRQSMLLWGKLAKTSSPEC